jgi:phage recombination protein Bet
MSTELTTVNHGASLAIAAQQVEFTGEQVKALAHIGVDKASEGDLRVFFHVCQRTGLDPFARQIHMIGRQVSEMGADGQWTKVTKQTIQTGIDGFRLIGRRAADRARHRISISAPDWCHEDGTWRPVWRKVWGSPVAARVSIIRDGEPFTAVAMYDEYVQTKRSGEPNSMWVTRPAGQLAKCAEALAWRLAFPQDLSGIYADDEMGQADNTPREAPQATEGSARIEAMLSPEPEIVTVEQVEPTSSGDPGISSGQLKMMGALMKEAGITDRASALQYVNDVLADRPEPVTSRNELTVREAGRVIDALLSDTDN